MPTREAEGMGSGGYVQRSPHPGGTPWNNNATPWHYPKSQKNLEECERMRLRQPCCEFPENAKGCDSDGLIDHKLGARASARLEQDGR
ncbi:hypothetical protein HRbin30_00476 [bacterium HR30]|nr:hypothetical protein HRbin30_00476 [bacterium HR30]